MMWSMWNAPSDRDYYGEGEAEYWERVNEECEEAAEAAEAARDWESVFAMERAA